MQERRLKYVILGSKLNALPHFALNGNHHQMQKDIQKK